MPIMVAILDTVREKKGPRQARRLGRRRRLAWTVAGALAGVLLTSPSLSAQSGMRLTRSAESTRGGNPGERDLETTQDWNQRLQELLRSPEAAPTPSARE